MLQTAVLYLLFASGVALLLIAGLYWHKYRRLYRSTIQRGFVRTPPQRQAMFVLWRQIYYSDQHQRFWLVINTILCLIGMAFGHVIWTCYLVFLIAVPVALRSAELKGRVAVKWELEGWQPTRRRN